MPSILPLTVCPTSGLWNQVEYVACRKAGFGFAAHREGDLKQWFHYKIGDQCVSLLIFGRKIEKRIVHKFTAHLDWINQCRFAVAKESV